MDYRKIGEFICQLRKEKDMTQKDLADELHITVQAVSKWERGLGCPDISHFKPLSKMLNVSINELMNGEKISDENTKEKADNAILNALSHSQGLINKKNKQLILIIVGILLITYSFNIYGVYNDFVIILGIAISKSDIVRFIVMVLGISITGIGILFGKVE